MQHLGHLEGRGGLHLGSDELGLIDYAIDVWAEPSGIKSAEGRASGDFTTLHKVLEAQGVELEFVLDDGQTLKLIIENVAPDFAGARIVVNGAVPGF